ncbi:hypothetical protein GWR56_07220 [Mucilaginibacter sp. 14171R-50]|uniref:hypothetical protein n=1 Tax=Mucilaginibacter sp. 14171R-50 TaxID=2703789 RepID=UPI00138C8866|nr:hypothetical protein [Mucilaginibacter sp. 14171R-50]QHS55338.1 hypothetical protein GWR56_07220 [Mucilaginibacter sp. 14171R-50]
MKPGSKTNGNHGKPLKTEHPLSEKDEQARRLEGVKKLQAEALKLWHALMKKNK